MCSPVSWAYKLLLQTMGFYTEACGALGLVGLSTRPATVRRQLNCPQVSADCMGNGFRPPALTSHGTSKQKTMSCLTSRYFSKNEAVLPEVFVRPAMPVWRAWGTLWLLKQY